MAENSSKATRVKQYDYIIRSRYDTKYLTNLLPLLEKDLLLLSEDIGGSAPWDTWKDTRSVFDGFAAGNYINMQQYYNFVDWLPNISLVNFIFTLTYLFRYHPIVRSAFNVSE